MPERSRLFDRLRERIRFRHYSIRTEEAYGGRIRCFTRFYGRRHPREIGSAEVEAVPARLDGQYHSAIWLPHAPAQQYPNTARERRRHSVDKSSIRKAGRGAVHAAGIEHADVRTTRIYTPVIERGECGGKSTLDGVLAGVRSASVWGWRLLSGVWVPVGFHT